LPEKQLSASHGTINRRLFEKIQSDCLIQFQRAFEEFEEEKLPLQRDEIEHGLEHLFELLENVIDATPEEILVYHEPSILRPERAEGMHLRILKWKNRLRQFFLRRPPTVRLQLRKRLSYDIQVPIQQAVFAHEEAFGIITYQLISELQKWLSEAHETFSVIENNIDSDDVSMESIEQERVHLTDILNGISEFHEARIQENSMTLLSENRRLMQTLCDDAVRLDIYRRIRKQCQIPKTVDTVKARILGVPIAWHKNCSLMVHYTVMEIHLMYLQHRIVNITHKCINEFQSEVDTHILNPLRELESIPQSLTGNTMDGFTERFQAILGSQQGIDSYAIIKDLDDQLRIAIQRLPETVEIIDEESFQHIDTIQYEGTEAVSINLGRLVNYTLESELIDPLHKHFLNIQPQLVASRNVAFEVVRLLQFNQESSENSIGEGDIGSQETLTDIVGNIRTRVAKERSKVERILEQVTVLVTERVHSTFGKLNPYLISRSEWIVDQNRKGKESRRLFAAGKGTYQRFTNNIYDSFVTLLYRRSEGVLLARKLSGVTVVKDTSVDTMLSLVDNVSPNPEVLTALPYYYRRLFTGKQRMVSEFRVGQQEEMKQAATVIRRYRQGFRGGMLVLGEPDSGKTALCRNITSTHFDESNVINLFAPEDGCIDVGRFSALLAGALHSEGDYEQMFLTVPSGSAIVFHDLELWWERGRNGFAVIDEIIRLIDHFSDKCLFIVNCSTHSFRFINRVKSIDKAFVGIVHCEPFDAKELQDAILLRHRTTGLKFEFGRQEEDQISSYALAKLFTKYFDYSAGNIGIALQAWICSIEKYQEEILTIRSPRRPATAILNQLQGEWNVWLQQFVLHKLLTVERLARIFREDESHISAKVNEMKRSGLLVESNTGILRINPYLRPFIIQKFVETKML
jgi:hypothetical protein